jgi:hypothetical protein
VIQGSYFFFRDCADTADRGTDAEEDVCGLALKATAYLWWDAGRNLCRLSIGNRMLCPSVGFYILFIEVRAILAGQHISRAAQVPWGV